MFSFITGKRIHKSVNHYDKNGHLEKITYYDYRNNLVRTSNVEYSESNLLKHIDHYDDYDRVIKTTYYNSNNEIIHKSKMKYYETNVSPSTVCMISPIFALMCFIISEAIKKS